MTNCGKRCPLFLCRVHLSREFQGELGAFETCRRRTAHLPQRDIHISSPRQCAGLPLGGRGKGGIIRKGAPHWIHCQLDTLMELASGEKTRNVSGETIDGGRAGGTWVFVDARRGRKQIRRKRVSSGGLREETLTGIVGLKGVASFSSRKKEGL